jgi:hypothetical protein
MHPVGPRGASGEHLDRRFGRQLNGLGVPVKEETHAQRTGELTGRFYQPIPLAAFRWGKKRPRTAAQAAARKGGFGVRRPAAVVHPDDSTGLP